VIALSNLQIYPVLAAGAPASGPQSPLSSESSLAGLVDSHPNTVSGASTQTFTKRL
jgi:hypothetical protein